MNFKDAVLADVNDVFFNDDEFADEHVLGDESFLCIVIGNENSENSANVTSEHRYASQETFTLTKEVYVKSCDFYVPSIGSVLTLDGKEFYVDKANEEAGIIYLLLTANES